MTRIILGPMASFVRGMTEERPCKILKTESPKGLFDWKFLCAIDLDMIRNSFSDSHEGYEVVSVKPIDVDKGFIPVHSISNHQRVFMVVKPSPKCTCTLQVWASFEDRADLCRLCEHDHHSTISNELLWTEMYNGIAVRLSNITNLYKVVIERKSLPSSLTVPTWLTDEIVDEFAESSFITVKDFIQDQTTLMNIMMELKEAKWIPVGPADVCRYDRLDWSAVTPILQSQLIWPLMNLQNSHFGLVLSRLLGGDPVGPPISLPLVRRITAGSYQLLHADPTDDRIDLIFTFSEAPLNLTTKDPPDGAVVYISKSDDGNVVAVAPPLPNSLSIAFRTGGDCSTFLKRTSLKDPRVFYQILISFSVQVVLVN